MTSKAALMRRTLEPLDNLAVTRRYFQEIKRFDTVAVRGGQTDAKRIMKLWHPDGELRLTGPEPIGERVFKGYDEMLKFYANRGKGIVESLSTQLARVNVASTKSADHVTLSGTRYVVNRKGEGMQAPFTHNFRFVGGKIQSLHISVGKPAVSEIAPVGSLQIQDMGNLTAVAWMVA